jgi:hypothetical protein
VSGGDASSCGVAVSSGGAAGALPAGGSSNARLQEYALRAAAPESTPALAAALGVGGALEGTPASARDALAPYAATLPPDEGALVSRTGASTLIVPRAGAPFRFRARRVVNTQAVSPVSNSCPSPRTRARSARARAAPAGG